jgi:hypothetical protein
MGVGVRWSDIACRQAIRWLARWTMPEAAGTFPASGMFLVLQRFTVDTFHRPLFASFAKHHRDREPRDRSSHDE